MTTHVWAVDSHDIGMMMDEKRNDLIQIVLEGFPVLYSSYEKALVAATAGKLEHERDCDLGPSDPPIEWEETKGEGMEVCEFSTGEEGFVVRITTLPIDPG